MRFDLKSQEQLEMQTLHRVRDRLVGEQKPAKYANTQSYAYLVTRQRTRQCWAEGYSRT
jgi:hypothetical protein